MESYFELDEISKDILEEIGNIGTGNAVTALSSMIGGNFEVELPKIQVANYRETPELLGGAEMVETGILLKLDGELSGMLMFLLDEDFTRKLLNALLGEQERDLAAMDEMCKSALCEVGNIMCCSYINALAELMAAKIHVSVPDMCCDMAGAILSVPMIHFANLSDDLILIRNKFRTEQWAFVSHVLFLPELESLEKILDTLGE